MIAKWYENQCVLLTQTTRERLGQCRARRESDLRHEIEIREAELHARRDSTLDQSAPPSVVSDVALAKEIVRFAGAAAADGVREFANGLLMSQSRLGIHADLLRGYTASLVNEIRNVLTATQIFRSNLLPPWSQDPITQIAIQTCEEAIEERRKLGDCWPYAKGESSPRNLSWAPIIYDWETHKATQKIESVQGERIPEAVLRTLLASHYHIKPQDVDPKQIRQAGTELSRHYGPVRMIPLGFEANRSAKAAPDFKPDAQFWKEREDEFRKHVPPADSKLSANWSSLDESWTFHSGRALATPTLRAMQILQALGRAAAKDGLSTLQSTDPWLDWLEAVRCATNRSTGERLYSKISSTGSFVLGEHQLQQLAISGEPVPPGGLLEFIVSRQPSQDGVDGSVENGIAPVDLAEMRMVWDTTRETIEDLSTSSADFCLEIRSRVSVPDVGDTNGAPRETLLPSCDTIFGRNLDRLRLESGWSIDQLAKTTGVDKKLIIRHLSKGKKAHPSTLVLYATAFTKKLGRTVTANDLL